MNLVTCVTWVSKGYANPFPKKINLNNQLPKFIKSTTHKIKEDQLSDIEQCYDLENYDEDSDIIDNNLIYDPYLNSLNSEEEDDDYLIKSKDNLLICGVLHDDSNATLEIYIYNEFENSFYIHHDLILPYVPLSVEWISKVNSKKNIQNLGSNIIALGSTKSYIELWDLDVRDAIEPIFRLKHEKEVLTKCKKRYQGVLSLAWNKISRNLLASGTKGGLIHIWDVNTSTKLYEYDVVTNEKIICLQWHPYESNLLLACSNDGGIYLIDVRAPDPLNLVNTKLLTSKSKRSNAQKLNSDTPLPSSSSPASCDNIKRWKVAGNYVEVVLWNDHDPFYFWAASIDGNVHYYDCRQVGDPKLPVHTFNVMGDHEGSVMKSNKMKGLEAEDPDENISLAFNYPRLYSSHSSEENVIRVWDISSKADSSILATDESMQTLNQILIQTQTAWNVGERAQKAHQTCRRKIHALNLLKDLPPPVTSHNDPVNHRNSYDVIAVAAIGYAKPIVKKIMTSTAMIDTMEKWDKGIGPRDHQVKKKSKKLKKPFKLDSSHNGSSLSKASANNSTSNEEIRLKNQDCKKRKKTKSKDIS